MNSRKSSVCSITLTDAERNKLKMISETPIFPLDWNEVISTTKMLISSAIPTSLASIIMVCISLVCLRYIGTYGDHYELAGGNLGFAWTNVFCLCFFMSLDQGFGIIAARMYGADRYQELGILYQRHVCMSMALMTVMIIPMWFSDAILSGMELDPKISYNIGIFLRCAIPSVIASCIFSSTRFFLISQNVFHIQGIILAILLPLHIMWCHIFVNVMGMPVAGAAIAKSITDICAATILIGYIHYKQLVGDSWIPWDRQCLEGWKDHFNQTVKIGANTYIEAVAFEASLFIVSALNNSYIMGAHGMALNIMNGLFFIPLGTTMSMQAYMGNAVGEGSKFKAQKIVLSGLMVNSLTTLLNTIVLIFFNKEITEFFVAEEETQGILRVILFIYGFTHIADSYANCLGGILRVIGREEEVLKAFIINYFVIGLPSQYIVGVWMGYGYIAVWLSISTTVYCMFFAMLIKVLYVDWDREIDNIKKHMKLEEGTNSYFELLER